MSIWKKLMVFLSMRFLLCIPLMLLGGCSLFSPSLPPPLSWDLSGEALSFTHDMNDHNDPEMISFRLLHSIDDLKSKDESDYGTLKNIVNWTHDLWTHNGVQEPSSPDPLTILEEVAEGRNFRCVEYSVIIVACAQSLGIPARVLSLRRKDAETAEYGAGHVVAEVWIDEFQKWVMADGQAGVIPEMDGIPLNAVEFQMNITRLDSGLTLHSSTGKNPRKYLEWISPYLYYFQVLVDQKFYPLSENQKREKIMLVPKGANKPTVFQRKYPITDCTYISNPEKFYLPVQEFME